MRRRVTSFPGAGLRRACAPRQPWADPRGSGDGNEVDGHDDAVAGRHGAIGTSPTLRIPGFAQVLDALQGRLSFQSLGHSAGSVWLTELGLPITTVSAMMGHANPSFALACYRRDPRDTETMVAAVLARAAAAGS